MRFGFKVCVCAWQMQKTYGDTQPSEMTKCRTFAWSFLLLFILITHLLCNINYDTEIENPAYLGF